MKELILKFRKTATDDESYLTIEDGDSGIINLTRDEVSHLADLLFGARSNAVR